MTRSPLTEADRRTVLRSAGALSTVGIAGLAGCAGKGDSDGNGAETIPGSDHPVVDEWMTETDVGDADGTYEGEIVTFATRVT